MVSKFRRTLSSPTTANPSRKSPPPLKPCHVRSVSLPCRSHPLISHVDAEIRDLRSWTSAADRSSGWICDGLSRLKNLHDSVDDLLLLPQTRDSLRRRSDLVEKLLEDYLSFVDVYGRFREALAVFREDQLAAQVAARKRDESRAVDLCGKARKVFEKEMIKLLETVRPVGRWSESEIASVTVSTPDGDANLAGVLRDVDEAAASVTMSVFGAMSGNRIGKGWMVVMSSLLKMKTSSDERGEMVKMREFEEVEVERLCGLGKWGELLERMKEMERCVVGVESEVERAFKSLIGTRVSLLNLLTQNRCC